MVPDLDVDVDLDHFRASGKSDEGLLFCRPETSGTYLILLDIEAGPRSFDRGNAIKTRDVPTVSWFSRRGRSRFFLSIDTWW